jgi:hypothetical protein
VCETGLDFRYSPAASAISSRARAALGRVADLPSNKTIRAPPKDHDSVQGNTNGSQVYMLYKLCQAYPEYLVTYTT